VTLTVDLLMGHGPCNAKCLHSHRLYFPRFAAARTIERLSASALFGSANHLVRFSTMQACNSGAR
jgi:hypothetical protein